MSRFLIWWLFPFSARWPMGAKGFFFGLSAFVDLLPVAPKLDDLVDLRLPIFFLFVFVVVGRCLVVEARLTIGVLCGHVCTPFFGQGTATRINCASRNVTSFPECPRQNAPRTSFLARSRVDDCGAGCIFRCQTAAIGVFGRVPAAAADRAVRAVARGLYTPR